MKKRLIKGIIFIILFALFWLHVSPAGSQLLISQNKPIPAVCANPQSFSAVSCREMEQAILASTVRIVMETWIVYVEGVGYKTLFGDGHGTVKDGRYLVTHNHYEPGLLSLLMQPDPSAVVTITLFRANGERLLELPNTAVPVVAVDAETLILDFGLKEGRALFTTLGLASAEFRAWPSFSLQPGTQVAQINWDRQQTSVQWVTIETMTTEAGTPTAMLSSCVEKGASGGGLFWHGYHIGNNLSRSAACGQEVADGSQHYSKATLNTEVAMAKSR
jgi:hypothetical protein